MFDLCGPMKGCAPNDARNLFMEGDLKFKDNLGKVNITQHTHLIFNAISLILYYTPKVDAHCFLLTDMLLVCKTIAKKGLGTLKVSILQMQSRIVYDWVIFKVLRILSRIDVCDFFL